MSSNTGKPNRPWFIPMIIGFPVAALVIAAAGIRLAQVEAPQSASQRLNIAQPAPKETCGDPPNPNTTVWYPVFVDQGNLAEIQKNFCKDAISTTRKNSGVQTVQVASFSDRTKAEAFATKVGGVVGEPDPPKVIRTIQPLVEATQPRLEPTQPRLEPVQSPVEATQEPSEITKSKPITSTDFFIQTLWNHTEDKAIRVRLFAIREGLYEARKSLWVNWIVAAEDPRDAVFEIHKILVNLSIKNNHKWSSLDCFKMAEAIVGGLYEWDRNHPGDLPTLQEALKSR